MATSVMSDGEEEEGDYNSHGSVEELRRRVLVNCTAGAAGNTDSMIAESGSRRVHSFGLLHC